MKFVIQRVKEASVKVDGEYTGKIKNGYLVLIGVGHEDTKEEADKYIRKMINLRIFEDENGKTNLSLKDASCNKGNRPSFTQAGNPQKAEQLYEYIIGECKKEIDIVQTGVFGAHMEVSLINDGPFTVVLEDL